MITRSRSKQRRNKKRNKKSRLTKSDKHSSISDNNSQEEMRTNSRLKPKLQPIKPPMSLNNQALINQSTRVSGDAHQAVIQNNNIENSVMSGVEDDVKINSKIQSPITISLNHNRSESGSIHDNNANEEPQIKEKTTDVNEPDDEEKKENDGDDDNEEKGDAQPPAEQPPPDNPSDESSGDDGDDDDEDADDEDSNDDQTDDERDENDDSDDNDSSEEEKKDGEDRQNAEEQERQRRRMRQEARMRQQLEAVLAKQEEQQRQIEALEEKNKQLRNSREQIRADMRNMVTVDQSRRAIKEIKSTVEQLQVGKQLPGVSIMDTNQLIAETEKSNIYELIHTPLENQDFDEDENDTVQYTGLKRLNNDKEMINPNTDIVAYFLKFDHWTTAFRIPKDLKRIRITTGLLDGVLHDDYLTANSMGKLDDYDALKAWLYFKSGDNTYGVKQIEKRRQEIFKYKPSTNDISVISVEYRNKIRRYALEVRYALQYGVPEYSFNKPQEEVLFDRFFSIIPPQKASIVHMYVLLSSFWRTNLRELSTINFHRFIKILCI